MKQLREVKELIENNKEVMNKIKIIKDNHIFFQDLIAALIINCEYDIEYNHKLHMFLSHVMYEAGDLTQFNYIDAEEIGALLVKEFIQALHSKTIINTDTKH